MSTWNCCRLCLGIRILHPIFQMPEHHEKYTEIIYDSTGIKVEPSDSLPQTICTACVNFINDSFKFRKKCSETQKLLQNKEENTQVKLETVIEPLKSEADSVVSIDISDFITELKSYNVSDVLNEQYNDVEFQEPDIDRQTSTDVGDVVVKKVKKPVKRKVREQNGEKKEKAKEEIECEYCHKILTSKFSLRNHYKIHTGFDVVCEHCGKKFITKRLLLMHCRAKHGYEKTDKCSYCDYRASNAEQVKIHERLHTGEKPFSCGECGASFHRNSSYLQHVAIHLPDKTVQCSQCPARFKSVTLMRIHRSRHSAARYTFSCRVCRRPFARRRNVARHLQRVHQLQPDKDHVLRAKVA